MMEWQQYKKPKQMRLLEKEQFIYYIHTKEQLNNYTKWYYTFSAAAYSSVYILAMLQYPLSSPALSKFPASQFNGLSGSGADMSASMA